MNWEMGVDWTELECKSTFVVKYNDLYFSLINSIQFCDSAHFLFKATLRQVSVSKTTSLEMEVAVDGKKQ